MNPKSRCIMEAQSNDGGQDGLRRRASQGVFDDRLSHLIGHLYDAALDGGLWTGIAPRIAAAFDSTSSVLKLHTGPHVQILQCTDNMVVPDRRREWAAHWHRRDLWVERAVAFGLSAIVTDTDLVTPEEQRKTGFYQEWLRELDIFQVVGAAFPASDGAVGVLGIHRPQQGGRFTSADRRKVELFLPHLRRALQLGQWLTAGSVRHAAALDTLDRLDTGVIVVDRRRRIIHANALAEEMLRTIPEMGVMDRRLCLRDIALQDRFIRLVRTSVEAASGWPAEAEAAVAVPRAEKLPLTLTVAPLRPMGVLAPARPLALVLLRDPEHPALTQQGLQDLFGLTRTEALIASDLVAGRALDEIARRRRIGVATARSHLKRILAKTGTNRQAEAVALLSRSVASFRSR
jgi:DNA-binding CsgD family transcriptional regulator